MLLLMNDYLAVNVFYLLLLLEVATSEGSLLLSMCMRLIIRGNSHLLKVFT